MTMRLPMKLSSLFVALVTAGLASQAHALTQFQQEVPNGTVFRCQTCHIRAGGGEGWNAFGLSILVAGDANPDANPNDQNNGFVTTPADHWLEICDDDADGDGALNGEELNDEDCDGEADGTAVACEDGATEGPNGEPCISNPGDESSSPGDPGVPGGDGDDLGGGGCAAAPAAPVALLALLALARRRRA